MEAGLLFAFSAGFFGGFGHCIGMCGPVVASYTLSGASSSPVVDRVLVHILYNAGRITTYMFIGALMGLTGSFVNIAGKMSGLQNTVAVIAGVIMILLGMNIAGLRGRQGRLEGGSSIIIKAGRKLMNERSVWKYFPLGGLFGLLPCGLSYSIFAAAAGTGGFIKGMLIAMSFGLGTVPALLFFGFAVSYISTKLRGVLYRAAGIMVLAAGIYFLIRGLRPYVQV